MKRRKPEVIELDRGKLEAILARSKNGPLGAEDHETLKACLETLVWLTNELEKKTLTLKQLRKSLSINTKKSEKTADVLKKPPVGDDEEAAADATSEEHDETDDKERPKGHGRNGTDAYEGAEEIKVPHESLRPGDSCPKCETGKIYLHKPQQLVRVRGGAPIQADLWEFETLRCNLCGHLFRAKAPADFGKKKYDETSASLIGLLKYGSGLPFNRLARLQRNFGIPLPASTQWDIVKDAAGVFRPGYEELIRQAAQGKIVHNDDTSMKILEFLKENQQIEQEGSKERIGIYTTGIVATTEDHPIAIFFTGRQHAGENLEDVLAQRAVELDPAIHMCDGSSCNTPNGHKTIPANCLAHGRRHFVEVVDSFPAECAHVLETLRQVYKHDATARKEKLSPQARLSYHQEHSAKLMADLETWMNAQLDEKKVEPNSSLGGALSYMLKRWRKLTLFLREPDAPLDNNICERALKKVIIHRKNSLFYKTLNGARVGDIFMSLIYTAELVGASPFDYLNELQRHADQLRRTPHRWMPWNYQATLAEAETADAGH